MTGATRGAPLRVTAAALGAAALAGCAPLTPVKVDTIREMLSPPPLEVVQRRGCAATLLVFPPETQPVYDTTQMAYSLQPHQLAYFSRHEWGETPSQMLLPLLVAALRSSGCFDAVVTPPYPYAGTYGLRSEIKELVQDFAAEPATVRLSLHVQLSDDAANRVIASKEISATEPIRSRTPEAGVVAANAAVDRALQDVVTFVTAATSSSRSRP